MASSTSPSKSLRSMTRNQRVLRGTSYEPAQTPVLETEQKASGSIPAIAQLPDEELVETFKSDLVSIRTLVSCTICAQLLYEPWTLGCGHTYCYSCLSSWFVTNKHNKTCPDCRQAVKIMPAPSFLIKQLIETFITRKELMPADESPLQHRTKQKEENEIVEKDKIDPLGLFKGCFNGRARQRVQRDYEDGVSRCPECMWEWEGGSRCARCGLDLEDSELDSLHEFSDEDGPELYDLDLDVMDAWQESDDNGSSDGDGNDIQMERAGFLPPGYHDRVVMARQQRRALARLGGMLRRDVSSSVTSLGNSEDEEETESMRDFIEHDESGFSVPYIDENTYQESHSSVANDEEEEEGADEDDSADEEVRHIGSFRRRRGGRNQPPGSSGARRSVIILESSDTDESETPIYSHPQRMNWPSENGEVDEVALMNNGWSPLNHGNDSDDAAENGPSEVGSDTETLGRDQDGEEEDDGSRESTPRYGGFQSALNLRPGQHQNFFALRRARGRQQRISSSDDNEDENDEDEDEDEDEQRGPNFRDNDGDVEMSVSPMASSAPEDDSDSEEEVSQPQTRLTRSRSTRPAVQVTDLTGDSSDDSVRPAPRRRRPAAAVQWNRSQRDYSPQISQLFRQYQSEVRDAVAQSSPIHLPPVSTRWEIATRRATPTSRARTTHYRVLPPRRAENHVARDVIHTLERQHLRRA